MRNGNYYYQSKSRIARGLVGWASADIPGEPRNRVPPRDVTFDESTIRRREWLDVKTDIYTRWAREAMLSTAIQRDESGGIFHLSQGDYICIVLR